MIQDAFSSLGSIADEVAVSIVHIRSLRIVGQGMGRALENSVAKLLMLRRRRERRVKVMKVLGELKTLKDGIEEMKELFGRDEVEKALETYQKLCALFEGNLEKIRLIK